MLQSQLKTVNKQKLYLEGQLYKLRNVERSLGEEHYSTTAEIDYLTEQLEELKDKISEMTHQISQLEIERAATQSRIESHISILNNHKMDFDRMFAEERNASELRNKDLMQKEFEEQKIRQEKQKDIEKQNELQAAEVSAIEEECNVIERECSVLKKRNNAIMIKLRRKLVETEDTRREVMNKTEIHSTTKTQ